LILAYETCTIETSTLQSNMTSWEIPALNGGLNRKIIAVKLGPPNPMVKHITVRKNATTWGNAAIYIHMICYYGCILYPQLDTQLYHWFYNYVYIYKLFQYNLHYIHNLYS
jgi:hypothetical protein